MYHWLPDNLKANYDLHNLNQQYARGCYGLADIQDHYDLKTIDLANGIIKDASTGKVYTSNSKLEIMDIMNIARASKYNSFYSGTVEWLKAALIKGREEKVNKSTMSKIRNEIHQSKKDHDELYAKRDFVTQLYNVNEYPYFNGEKAKYTDEFLTYHNFYNSNYKNIIDGISHNIPFEDRNLSIALHFLRKRTQKLCQNTVYIQGKGSYQRLILNDYEILSTTAH